MWAAGSNLRSGVYGDGPFFHDGGLTGRLGRPRCCGVRSEGSRQCCRLIPAYLVSSSVAAAINQWVQADPEQVENKGRCIVDLTDVTPVLEGREALVPPATRRP